MQNDWISYRPLKLWWWAYRFVFFQYWFIRWALQKNLSGDLIRHRYLLCLNHRSIKDLKSEIQDSCELKLRKYTVFSRLGYKRHRYPRTHSYKIKRGKTVYFHKEASSRNKEKMYTKENQRRQMRKLRRGGVLESVEDGTNRSGDTYAYFPSTRFLLTFGRTSGSSGCGTSALSNQN